MGCADWGSLTAPEQLLNGSALVFQLSETECKCKDSGRLLWSAMRIWGELEREPEGLFMHGQGKPLWWADLWAEIQSPWGMVHVVLYREKVQNRELASVKLWSFWAFVCLFLFSSVPGMEPSLSCVLSHPNSNTWEGVKAYGETYCHLHTQEAGAGG